MEQWIENTIVAFFTSTIPIIVVNYYSNKKANKIEDGTKKLLEELEKRKEAENELKALKIAYESLEKDLESCRKRVKSLENKKD